MDIRPKRKKSKDNPYKIYKDESTYVVEFMDGQGILKKIEVSKNVFEAFDKFELVDKKQMNESERHIASYDLSEEYINKNIEQVSMDDELIMKSTFEELRKAIEILPDIQKRRIKMYYFDELSQQQIANLEKANIRNIQEV